MRFVTLAFWDCRYSLDVVGKELPAAHGLLPLRQRHHQCPSHAQLGRQLPDLLPRRQEVPANIRRDDLRRLRTPAVWWRRGWRHRGRGRGRGGGGGGRRWRGAPSRPGITGGTAAPTDNSRWLHFNDHVRTDTFRSAKCDQCDATPLQCWRRVAWRDTTNPHSPNWRIMCSAVLGAYCSLHR